MFQLTKACSVRLLFVMMCYAGVKRRREETRARLGEVQLVTGLGLGADRLFCDRQRPARHRSSSLINNRMKQRAKTAGRE